MAEIIDFQEYKRARGLMAEEKLEEINELDEDLEEEEHIANLIEAEQIRNQGYQELDAVYKEGASFDHPSYIKHGILFGLAGIITAVDFLELTGFGIIVAIIVSFLVSVIMFLISWLTNGKYKEAEAYAKNLEERLAAIQRNIAHATRISIRTAKILRHVPGIRNLRAAKYISRKVPRALVKVRRLAMKNPLTKMAIGIVVDIIPFIPIIMVYLSYRDEKTALRNAHNMAEEAME